eukprot:1155130-Rhodomonas_salina.2
MGWRTLEAPILSNLPFPKPISDLDARGVGGVCNYRPFLLSREDVLERGVAADIFFFKAFSGTIMSIPLRMCYAISGTERGYAATRMAGSALTLERRR